MIALSIVSHGHGAMVAQLVARLRRCPEVSRIVLTLNVPESLPVVEDVVLRVIRNAAPKGFGANHNAAFALCDEQYFCVLNPDIEFDGNPFPMLLQGVELCGSVLVAPLIVSRGGKVEDSARRFPTVASLLRKALGGNEGRYPVVQGQPCDFPDWVAGMFMLFRSTGFAELRGFDEGYYLYYEDVDICKRAWQAGLKVAVCPSVQVVHDARRASRRNLRHLRWHLASMARFLWRYR